MSYCRYGEASVYVFASEGGFACCGCPDTDSTYITPDAAKMLRHLKAHKLAGLKVPSYVFMGIFADRNEYRGGAQ